RRHPERQRRISWAEPLRLQVLRCAQDDDGHVGVGMNRDGRAMLYGLGAVGLWSTVATAFKVGLAHMSPLTLLWIASLVSWLLIAVLVAREGLWGHALRRGWRTAVWAGLMNPVAYYLVLFGAYERLPGQEAMALNYTWA